MSRKIIAAILVVVASVIVMDVVTASLVQANGSHAGDHLASAQRPLPLSPLLGVLMWALPQDKRRPMAWIAALVIISGAVIDTTGNLKVVDAIDGATWNDAEADQLGSSRAGFDSGHDLANVGMWVVVAGAIGFALVLATIRAISWRIGIVSAVASLVWPPWIAPGFGQVVVAIALLVAKNRVKRSAG